MKSNPDIIIIKGAPGSGKTQTAKSLARYYPKGVRIEIDTIRQMVISVDWKNQEEHIGMLQISTGMVLDFLKKGFAPVIVVDTFSGDKANHYIEQLQSNSENLLIKLFGLYVSESELERRISLRTEEEFRDLSICKKLNADILKWKHKIEIQIDTTGFIPAQSAAKIVEHINDVSTKVEQ